jgi:hypothetical protein
VLPSNHSQQRPSEHQSQRGSSDSGHPPASRRQVLDSLEGSGVAQQLPAALAGCRRNSSGGASPVAHQDVVTLSREVSTDHIFWNAKQMLTNPGLQHRGLKQRLKHGSSGADPTTRRDVPDDVQARSHASRMQ